MTSQTVVFKAEFRARGYSDEDLADLRASLQDAASVRLRGDFRPEAGGGAELIAVLEFIGVSLAKGAIGWVGKEAIARATKGLSEWWKRKAQRGTIEPEVQEFRASFDDVDIAFRAHRHDEGPDSYFLNAEALAAIPEALLVVEDHFSAAILAQHRVGFLEVPLISYDQGEPEFRDGANGTPDRYWKVGCGAPFANDQYDSQTRTFLSSRQGAHDGSDSR